MTKRYTQEATRFINDNKDKPFFLYMSHAMPHVPLHVSGDFKGRTKTLFGDVMEELDWSVGEVLKTLKECDLDKKTLVIFTSDNGAHQGSAGPLRGKKATMYEGGFRVPCIVRWPGRVPAEAVSDEVTATVDNGEIQSDFDVSRETHGRNSKAVGIIGKGGPTVQLSTEHGNIDIKKS